MEIARYAPLDPVACEIRKALESAKPPAGWELHGDQLCFKGHTYIPAHEPLRLQIICNHHNHPAAGHFGQTKTKDLVNRTFYWKGVGGMIKRYVKSCTTCARSKATRHKPYGLLKQLPILTKPWDSISMDFIEQLPASGNHTSILIIVDHCKQAKV